MGVTSFMVRKDPTEIDIWIVTCCECETTFSAQGDLLQRKLAMHDSGCPMAAKAGPENAGRPA